MKSFRDALVVLLVLIVVGSCEAMAGTPLAPAGYRLETRKTGIWPFRGEERVLVPNPVPVKVEITAKGPAADPQAGYQLDHRRQVSLRDIVDSKEILDRYRDGIRQGIDNLTPETRAVLPGDWAKNYEQLMTTQGREEYLKALETALTEEMTVAELEALAKTRSFAGPKATKVLDRAHSALAEISTRFSTMALGATPDQLREAEVAAERMAAARAARRLTGLDVLSLK